MQLNLYLCALLVIVTPVVANDCQSGILKCESDLTSSAIKHPTDKDLLCKDIRVFIGCIFAQKCGLTSSDEQKVVEAAQKYFQTYGLSCTYSVEDVIREYKNGATRISTSSSFLLASFSLVLVAMGRKLFFM